MTHWVFMPPDKLREQLVMYEMEVASIKLALEGVEQGHVVLLGDGPYGPRYTARRMLADPLHNTEGENS